MVATVRKCRTTRLLSPVLVLALWLSGCGQVGKAGSSDGASDWTGSYPYADSDRVIPFGGELVSFSPRSGEVSVRSFSGGAVTDLSSVKVSGDIWAIEAGSVGKELWLLVTSCSEKIVRGDDFPNCPGQLALHAFRSSDGQTFGATEGDSSKQLGDGVWHVNSGPYERQGQAFAVLGDYTSDRQLDVTIDSGGFHVDEQASRDQRDGAFCNADGDLYFLSSAPNYGANQNGAFRLQRSDGASKWEDIPLPDLPAGTYNVSLNCASGGAWLTYHEQGHGDLLALSDPSARVRLEGLSRVFSSSTAADLFVVSLTPTGESQAARVDERGKSTVLERDRYEALAKDGEPLSLWSDSASNTLYLGLTQEGKLNVASL